MDKYTKSVLTIIAVSLGFIALGGKIEFPPKAEAGGNAANYVTHMEVDSGDAFIHWGRNVFYCNARNCRKLASIDPN